MRFHFTIILSVAFMFNSVAQVPLSSAPDFTVKDVDGALHHLYEYLDAGNLVVIDFFTTNCGPCQTYASEISASFEHFGCNYSNVIYLGINWGSDNETVRQFDEMWGAHYPSVSGLQGSGNAVVELYEVQSYPTVILIAPDRSIIHNHIWPPDQSTLNALVFAAGGVSMICTVDAENLPISESPGIKVTNISSGNVSISLQNTINVSQRLQVYSVDGRLVYNQSAISDATIISLRPGVYFASLFENGNWKHTLRFVVL